MAKGPIGRHLVDDERRGPRLPETWEALEAVLRDYYREREELAVIPPLELFALPQTGGMLLVCWTELERRAIGPIGSPARWCSVRERLAPDGSRRPTSHSLIWRYGRAWR